MLVDSLRDYVGSQQLFVIVAESRIDASEPAIGDRLEPTSSKLNGQKLPGTLSGGLDFRWTRIEDI
jgi:hypothetical protein